MCGVCGSILGLRESAKYSFDQDWLVEGRLADYDGSLGGTAAAEPMYGSVGKAKIMKITHQLVADLHGVRQVIDSVNRCIFVARSGMHLMSLSFSCVITSWGSWGDG